MGSVSRRFARNILAKNIATRAGIIEPVIVGRNFDGKKVYFTPSKITPLIHYRALFLRVAKQMRELHKRQHDVHQKGQGRLSRLREFFGNWSKSWLRRMLEKILPSFKEDRKKRRLEREARHARFPTHQGAGVPTQARR